MPHRWSTSDRRATLPPDWPVIRRRVLARDKRTCQACGSPATDVDHIGNRYDHSMANLQALCSLCHSSKTVTEAHEAMRQQRAKARHPQERAPGLH